MVGTVYDVAMELERTRDWVISRVALQEGSKRFGRKGQTHVVEWRDVDGFAAPDTGAQGATHLLAALEEMRPADLANVIHDLPAKRRGEIAAALDDERLADVLEELPEEDQVEILGVLDQRARRRRPRGDVPRRRRRPDRRAADRDRRAAAPADGARGGRGRPAADVLRGAHRRRHDDHRAGDPLPRRDRGRRPRARPQRRAQPVAGRAGVRRPSPARAADRPAARRRAHPAAAARAALDHGRARARHRHRAAAAELQPRGLRAAPRDLQPGRRPRRRRGRPAGRRRDRRRPARPPAPGELARHPDPDLRGGPHRRWRRSGSPGATATSKPSTLAARLAAPPAAPAAAGRAAPVDRAQPRREARAAAARPGASHAGPVSTYPRTRGARSSAARRSTPTSSVASRRASRGSWAPRASSST